MTNEQYLLDSASELVTILERLLAIEPAYLIDEELDAYNRVRDAIAKAKGK